MAKTVIIIDDDQDDLDTLKACILTVNPSFDCRTFASSPDAMRILSTEFPLAPDFLFTDINMPGIRGDDCVRQLRENSKFDHTIIAVLSTTLQPAMTDTLKRLGANYVYAKPTHFTKYADILKDVFSSDSRRTVL